MSKKPIKQDAARTCLIDFLKDGPTPRANLTMPRGWLTLRSIYIRLISEPQLGKLLMCRCYGAVTSIGLGRSLIRCRHSAPRSTVRRSLARLHAQWLSSYITGVAAATKDNDASPVRFHPQQQEHLAALVRRLRRGRCILR